MLALNANDKINVDFCNNFALNKRNKTIDF